MAGAHGRMMEEERQLLDNLRVLDDPYWAIDGTGMPLSKKVKLEHNWHA